MAHHIGQPDSSSMVDPNMSSYRLRAKTLVKNHAPGQLGLLGCLQSSSDSAALFDAIFGSYSATYYRDLGTIAQEADQGA